MFSSQYYITSQMLRAVGMPEKMIPYARPGVNYDPLNIDMAWRWMVQDGLTNVFDKMAMPHTPWEPERRGIEYDAMSGLTMCEVSSDLSTITPEDLQASGWPDALVTSIAENAKGSAALAAYEEAFLAKRAAPSNEPAP